MEHGSNLIERIKTDLKAFEFGLIRLYPLYPLFPRSIKVLFVFGSSGLGLPVHGFGMPQSGTYKVAAAGYDNSRIIRN